MPGVCVGRGCWDKLVIGHFSSSNQEQLHMYLFFNLLIYIWSKISISSKIWLVRFWKLNMRQNSNSNFNFIFDPSCTVLPSYNPWGACLQAMIVPNRSFQFLVPNQSFSSICESWSWACVLKGALQTLSPFLPYSSESRPSNKDKSQILESQWGTFVLVSKTEDW